MTPNSSCNCSPSLKPTWTPSIKPMVELTRRLNLPVKHKSLPSMVSTIILSNASSKLSMSFLCLKNKIDHINSNNDLYVMFVIEFIVGKSKSLFKKFILYKYLL